jgi:tetratricopeptide (TPR) repeat protein
MHPSRERCRNASRCSRGALSCCSWALLFGIVGALHAGEPAPATAAQLRALAERYEQDGLKGPAAGVYEDLIRVEPESRLVLAGRLVELYIETRQSQKALDWAREVMKTNPEPRAYLAGVYAQLGGYNEARALLEAELEAAATNDVTRRLQLLWQMSDVEARAGHREKARQHREEAARLAEGTPHESQARARRTGDEAGSD